MSILRSIVGTMFGLDKDNSVLMSGTKIITNAQTTSPQTLELDPTGTLKVNSVSVGVGTLSANSISANLTGSPAAPSGATAAQINTFLGTTITPVDALPDGTATIALTDVFPFEHDPTATKVVQQVTLATLLALTKPMKVLAQTGIPFVLLPNGTMGNNGANVLGTALGTTYASFYGYYPAGAIAAGSLAGWYYHTGSSTTAITAFNNTYTSGQPTIPAPPIAFATTGPGAYTQTVATDIPAIVVPVTGNTMGVNGAIEVSMMMFNNNSAGVKKVSFFFGGSACGAANQTTSTASAFMRSIKNRGVAGAQVGINNVFGDASTGSATYLSKDTTTTQNVELKPNIAVATDYDVIEWFTVKLVPN